MSYKLFIIPPTGPIEILEQRNAPDLEQLQRLVGGYIQLCPVFGTFEHEGVVYSGNAWVDEEGLMKRLPPNPTAIAAWKKACPEGNPIMMGIVGTLVFEHRPRKTKVRA